ncbi:MAG TPA: transglycosylase SLT domain-containing protein [Anaerolineales bacterium]|nr:transglycosylase SLT domain-containing protein [Anaerolineales bacterium]
MPRARSIKHDDWQTAASTENGSGCLSVSSLSIIGVFLIIGLVTALGLSAPMPVVASSQTNPTNLTSLSPIFTHEVQYWESHLIRWANTASLDPNLAAVVMQIESCGDPRALSRAGAKGLFQVMPFHFRFGENAYDPETNALRGMNYLARSLNAANGDARLALAGYNGGIGVIARAEWLWSAETKRYVYFGVPIYEDAHSGKTTSPMLDEWYRRYGAGLCRQAAERLGIAP